jgi:phosphonate transport system permease protein
MPVTTVNGIKSWQQRDRTAVLKQWLVWMVGTLIFVFCWQIVAGATRWEFVLDAPKQGAEFFGRMFPPRWSYLDALWLPLWDTLNIATLGTLLSLLFAFPLAFAAAGNTTPHPTVRLVALLIIVVSRSVNALIWALLLVSILGPGVLAGVIAIGLRSIGFVSKLFYEAIEETSREPVEAISATGATRLQVLSYALLPQVLPSFAGVSVFRWDINIRESTVIGLVGAGGIGINLSASVNALRWDQVSLIFTLIFLMVLVSEWISARVRQKII